MSALSDPSEMRDSLPVLSLIHSGALTSLKLLRFIRHVRQNPQRSHKVLGGEKCSFSLKKTQKISAQTALSNSDFLFRTCCNFLWCPNLLSNNWEEKSFGFCWLSGSQTSHYLRRKITAVTVRLCEVRFIHSSVFPVCRLSRC